MFNTMKGEGKGMNTFDAMKGGGEGINMFDVMTERGEKRGGDNLV